MSVTFRVFGTGCDWFPAAAEAQVCAMAALPWAKALRCAPPRVLDRRIGPDPLPDIPQGPLTLHLVSPVDDEGSKADDTRNGAARLLSRALRRVDALEHVAFNVSRILRL